MRNILKRILVVVKPEKTSGFAGIDHSIQFLPGQPHAQQSVQAFFHFAVLKKYHGRHYVYRIGPHIQAT